MREKIFEIPSYSGTGIYAIINRTKMKAYIGQSHNIKYRAIAHENKIKNRNHEIDEISEDFEDEFGFVVLHKTFDNNPEFLSLLEELYMLTFVDNGFYLYNKNGAGFGNSNAICRHIAFGIASHFSTKENMIDEYFNKFGNQYHFDMRSVRAKEAKKNKSKTTNISVDK